MALVAGIQHLRDGIEPQAVLAPDMAIVGIIGTAPDADADAFPLNTPINLRTNDSVLRAKLGADGTLEDALAGISSVLAGVNAARTVVVRVAEGANATETIANMLGSEAAGTGVWAFLDAPEELGITPRILIAPGFTSQTSNGVASVTIGTAGEDYEVGDVISGSGGGGTGFSATVASVDGSGAITGVEIVNGGSGYTSAPTLTVTSSAGKSAVLTATIDQLANPICALMPTITARLNAKFIPEGPTNTRQAALDWLETLPRSADILHPLRQDAKVMDSEGDIVTKPLSPYIAGLYVRVDAEHGGVPSHSIANQSVGGIVGVTPSIPFSITDGNSLGQLDLERSFGIVYRGDFGVDGALTDGGFGFWGTDTLSDQSEWLFANVNRMRDYLEIMQTKATRKYLGRYNLTLQTVQAVLNTIESQCLSLKANGHILDYKTDFNPDENQPEQLRLGHISLIFAAEEPPVLRKITIRSRRHREALENMVRNIAIMVGSQVVG